MYSDVFSLNSVPVKGRKREEGEGVGLEGKSVVLSRFGQEYNYSYSNKEPATMIPRRSAESVNNVVLYSTSTSRNSLLE